VASGDPDRGVVLLAVARAALCEELGREGPPVPSPAGHEWLTAPGASFVTLELGGVLRGCIGSLEAHRPLIEDVRANAVAAAIRDPRFPRLEAGELDRLQIEVSVLSRLEPVEVTDEADLARRLRPGVDGVVLEHRGRRGTFLPAVWRHLPRPAEFLRQLKRKAGLEPDFWSPEMRISRYTVDSWAERAR
jgi:AmmeMemoRadiSam system protein A